MAETLYDTSAQAFVPQLLGRDRLTRANARLFAVELTANQFAGTATEATAGATLGAAWTMASTGNHGNTQPYAMP